MILSEDLSKEFKSLNLDIIKEGELEVRLSASSIQPTFFEEILKKQIDYPNKLCEKVKEGKTKGFATNEDGSLRFKGRWCEPDGCSSLKARLQDEAHNS